MTAPSARHLRPHERRVALDALEAVPIAAMDTCELALARCLLLPWRPSLAQSLRGPRALIASLALAQRASGITLGPQVYIHARCWSPQGDLPLPLVVHEVAHVVQFTRDGAASFLARYLRDYGRNLLRGMSDYEAYLHIPYEIEARRVEAHLSASWG